MSGSLTSLDGGAVAGAALAQSIDLHGLLGGVQTRPTFKPRTLHVASTTLIVSGTTYFTEVFPLAEAKEFDMLVGIIYTAPGGTPSAPPTSIAVNFQVSHPTFNGTPTWQNHPDDALQTLTPGVALGVFGVKQFTQFGAIGRIAFTVQGTWADGDATTKFYIAGNFKS